MAQSATETRKSRRAAARDTEDSVDAEFGQEYSESSLELLRKLGRKGAQFGEVEPWEKQAFEPPPQEECDAAIEELESLDRELEQVKQYVPDARELAWIDYKRALVEDASDNEVTWLKLKAYYHGVNALRTSYAQQDGATTTPTNKLPIREDTEEEKPGSVAAAREAVLKAARSLLPSSSEDEEDGAAVAAMAAAGRQASHAQASSSHTHGGMASVHNLRPLVPVAATSAALATSAKATLYQQDYLDELRLTQKLARQRQQRSHAFWLGLAAAVGISVTRWWLRRRRSRNSYATAGTSGHRLATATQPVPQ